MRAIYGTIIATTIIGGYSASARAEASGDWDLSGFRTQTVEMSIATNRKTGHKMHVIRLRDGSIMAMVPATSLWELMKDRALGDEGN